LTLKEFTPEVKKLEAAKGVPIPRSVEEIEYRDLRRLAVFELVERFPLAVFQEARRRLCGTDGSDDPRFFPHSDEIVEVCEEVVEESKPKETLPRSKFIPAVHKCGPKPGDGPAIEELKFLCGLSAPPGYEAEHILCRGKIAATCPVCGKHHLELGVFDEIIRRYPEETENWNPLFKGLMLCSKCAAKTLHHR